MTLGLIWTIILRFQLSQHLDFASNFDLKLIKDSLLLWCQSKTRKQHNCDIKDFNQSWTNGWAFVELIRSIRPELIDTYQMKKLKNVDILDSAFQIADQHLMIPKILDASDVINSPDENSIMTYVSYFYNLYCKTKSSETGIKRIKFVLDQASNIHNVQQNYEQMVTELLAWIGQKCVHFQTDIDINQAHEQMSAFNDYFRSERPSKLKLRNECESIYFEIQNMQKKLGFRRYVPQSGLTVKDVEKAWLRLEQIETRRQDKLKKNIVKCEQLTKLADLFDLKNLKMEKYISDKLQMLNQIFKPQNCSNLDQLEAHLKQSELICCDILSNNVKLDTVNRLADELTEHKFNNYEFISICKNHLQIKMNRLIDLAAHNQRTIESTNRMINYVRELDCMQTELVQLQSNIKLVPFSGTNSIQNIFVYLEKLKQQENYLRMLERQFLEVQSRICFLTDNNNNSSSYSILLDSTMIHSKLNILRNKLDHCRQLIKDRVQINHLNLEFNKFKDEIEFIQMFLHEKEILTRSKMDDCYDQNNIVYLQRRNNITKLELKSMEQRFYDACQEGYHLMQACDIYESQVNELIDQTGNNMKKLIQVINERTFLINDTVGLFRICDQLAEFDFFLIGDNYKDLKEQVLNILREHDEICRLDLIQLTELIEQFNGLSIECNLTEQKNNHVVYLKKYQSLDQCLNKAEHAFLIIRIEQPIQFLREMYTKLLSFVTKNFHIAQQLLTAIEFDSNKLRNILIEQNIIECELSPEQTRIGSNMVDTEKMFDLLLSGNNLNQFIATMQDRHKSFESDMNSMSDLMSFVRNTLHLLKVTQTFTCTFVNMKNKPNIESSPNKRITDHKEVQTQNDQQVTDQINLQVTLRFVN